jgi:hypothetical protein
MFDVEELKGLEHKSSRNFHRALDHPLLGNLRQRAAEGLKAPQKEKKQRVK